VSPCNLIIAALLLACSVAAHAQAIFIYKDNPENGLAYDPSDAKATPPSALKADGFGRNKLPLLPRSAFPGRQPALLEFASRSGGAWRAQLSPVHWKLQEVPTGSMLVLDVNSERPIPAAVLPTLTIVWETGPESRAFSISTLLTNGIDAHPATWQRVEIPISRFNEGPVTRRLRGLALAQSGADAQTYSLLIDNVHFIPPERAPLPQPPTALRAVVGDRSVNLYWNASAGVVDEYLVQRRVSPAAEWQTVAADPIRFEAFADVQVANGQTYEYRVRAKNLTGEGDPSETVQARPAAYVDDLAFLDHLQHTGFWYFWQQANATNGLTRDRSHPHSFSSIAATGFGLTAIPIAVERQWIPLAPARQRVLTTLRTFADGPQGPDARGMIGHKGWFYHFLEMDSATRFANSELSSIDTTLLLGGIIFVREYFKGDHPEDRQIRELANRIFARIDWKWMLNGEKSLTMGWHPESGFIKSRWIGYNEAMLLYIFALGAGEGKELGPDSWRAWTKGYDWKRSHGLSFLHFEPMFGHQYSHCWVDFRMISDDYMRKRGIDYFENSHRAALAQQQYALANPKAHKGYGQFMWGFTACDGPGYAGVAPYMARGAPPALNDDGTIAPTAVGGSIVFAPQITIPTLRNIYETQRTNLWGPYGFYDAFNLSVGWHDNEALGIDQGPIVLMIENFRSELVWKTFMRSSIVQRGLNRAGFKPRNPTQK